MIRATVRVVMLAVVAGLSSVTPVAAQSGTVSLVCTSQGWPAMTVVIDYDTKTIRGATRMLRWEDDWIGWVDEYGRHELNRNTGVMEVWIAGAVPSYVCQRAAPKL